MCFPKQIIEISTTNMLKVVRVTMLKEFLLQVIDGYDKPIQHGDKINANCKAKQSKAKQKFCAVAKTYPPPSRLSVARNVRNHARARVKHAREWYSLENPRNQELSGKINYSCESKQLFIVPCIVFQPDPRLRKQVPHALYFGKLWCTLRCQCSILFQW